MNAFSFWRLAAVAGMALLTLVAVLGIWGVVDGVVALKIYFTMFFVGCAALLIRNSLHGSHRQADG